MSKREASSGCKGFGILRWLCHVMEVEGIGACIVWYGELVSYMQCVTSGCGYVEGEHIWESTR